MPLVHKNNFFNSLSIFFNYYKLTQLIKHLAKKTNNKKKNLNLILKKERKKEKEPTNLWLYMEKDRKKKKSGTSHNISQKIKIKSNINK